MQDTVTDETESGIDPKTPIEIGEDVETGESVELPVEEILTGRAFLTGKSGSGKSNSANVIAESLLDRGLALLIIDTEGEYYSLREEYEILHVGTEPDQEYDLHVGPEHGEKLAELALEQNVPIILDVSDTLEGDEERDDLIYETVRHLFYKEKQVKKPFLIIAEEAHNYIPQRGAHDDLSKMMITVGKQGRKRGLGMLGVSQRPQDVRKEYISQCDWILWHRLTWDSDTKVVGRVADNTTANAVEGLDDGEGFLQADFVDEDIIRVQMRRMKTFDAGATPGLDGFDRPELKSLSDDDLVDELESISEREEQRQDRMEKLESQLEEREDRIEELEERVERLKDLREMVDSTEGLPDATETQADDTDLSSVTLEIDGDTFQSPEVIEAQVMEIQQAKEDAEEQLEAVREERDELAQKLDERKSELDALRDQLERYEWIADHIDEMEEATKRLSRILDIDSGATDSEIQERLADKDEQIEDLRRERDDLKERLDALEEQAETSDPTDEYAPIVSTDDEELDALLSDGRIKEEFVVAVEEGKHAEEHYPNHLSVVVDAEDGVTPQLASEILSVSDALSRNVLRELRDNGFLRAEGERPETFYLDTDRLEKRVRVADRV
jgi:peptidoglycan hydrolase CwlO-like protein